MFIRYNGTNVHALPYVTFRPVQMRNKKTGKSRTEMKVDNTQTPQQVHWLRPGWNEFPAHIWKQNEKNPSIMQMLKKGTIELMNETVQARVRNKKTGKVKVLKKVVGQDDSEISLKYFSDSKAVDIVKNTWNRDILQRWLDEETRHKVKRALTKQIDPLLNNTTKEEDEDNF